MSLPEQLRERDGDVTLTVFLSTIVKGYWSLVRGWRAPARHEHDAADALAVKADAAVNRAIAEGRARMEGEGHEQDAKETEEG